MKFCPFCGQKVLPDTRFCQECGSLVNEQETQTEVKEETRPEIDKLTITARSCKKCGTLAEGEDLFCQECGNKLPEASGESSIHAHEQNETAAINEPNLVCLSCGMKLSPGGRFCEECGKPAGLESIKPPPGPNQNEAATDQEKPQMVNAKLAEAPQEPVISEKKQPYADEPVEKNIGPEIAKTSGKRKLFLLLSFIVLLILGSVTWYLMTTPSSKEPLLSDSTFLSDTMSKSQLSDSVRVAADSVQLSSRGLNNEKSQEKSSGQRQTAQSSSVNKTAPAATKTEILKSAKKDQNRSASAQRNTKHKSMVIFSNWNEQPVKNNPGREVKFEIDTLTVITRITTMHFNEGKGDSAGGTISIVGDKRLVYGVWKCEPKKGDDGTKYAKWVCKPDVTLPPGNYRIINSGEKTWSFNKESGRRGLIIIEGYPK